MRIITIKDNVQKSIYGNKAYWLSWLYKNGFEVPYAIFISSFTSEKFKDAISNVKNKELLRNAIKNFIVSDNKYSVAIRSSGSNEDSITESKAGHFNTFIGLFTFDEVIEKIYEVIQSIKEYDHNNGMGVIIQQRISSKFSGVIFSSNSLNGNKEESIVSLIEGMGEQLVSGKKVGEDLIIKFENDKPIIPQLKLNIKQQILNDIILKVKNIEKRLNFPIDVEWCIDDKNKIHYLQCRPITNLNIIEDGIIKIDINSLNRIPKQVIHHDKVSIRLLAEKSGVKISNAYIAAFSCPDKQVTIDFSKIKPEKYCNGFSLVSIFPKKINGKIIRAFSNIEISKQKLNYRTCQRYDIRTYEDCKSLEKNIINIANYCFQYSWLTILIIQEIFDPYLTGIIKKKDDNFIIEIGKGHFIPKGIIPTTHYIVNNNGHTVYKNEITQKYFYSIINGIVKKNSYNKMISISNNILKNIIDALLPIMRDNNTVVEFGLLKENSEYIPYLIDIVDINNDDLSSDLIRKGVISKGKITGIVKNINVDDENSFNLHFHDESNNEVINKGKYIFCCDTPDIALLKIIYNHNPSNIGFIFKNGSLLSHLSIVLREKNIPAIISNVDFNDNLIVSINTFDDNNENIEPVIEKGYVFSYVNPDADGVISSIAYSFLNNSFIPSYFGILDKETTFILNYFNYPFPLPINVGDISNSSLIALVDTHHISQLPTNINRDNVIEIIDHHTEGDVDKFKNAIITNEKIGAASTILIERMKKNSLQPDKKLAGLLALSIVSNTLNFTAPSTSERDINAYNWLNNIYKVDDDLIKKMFIARSDLSNYSYAEIINNNTKKYSFGNNSVAICQLEMVDILSLLEKSGFIDELKIYFNKNNFDYFLFSGVDIFDKKTYIKSFNEKTNRFLSFFNYKINNKVIIINKILLRKTEFIPKFKEYFKNDAEHSV